MIKVIKTEADYEDALAAIEQLVDMDPAPGTDEANTLEVLAVLVEQYEKQAFPTDAPTPLAALQFRMDQQGLVPRDLVPYIGSRSKVSEVLSGKRPLTLSMLQALHVGLGIPAPALLQKQLLVDFDETQTNVDDVDWNRFPFREMVARGWIKAEPDELPQRREELLHQFFAPLGGPRAVAGLYRKSDHIRAGRILDHDSLVTWTAYVLRQALQNPPKGNYRPNTVSLDFMREVAKLSHSITGPRLVQEFLGRHGIVLVVEPHLPQTLLDGVALLTERGYPVIGLTLRYDRLDNFWFTLLHELAHVALHLRTPEDRFYDDLDVGDQGDKYEQEADEMSGVALIATEAWATSAARHTKTPEAVIRLAQKLGIHPAIVAGRIRREANDYRLLSRLVGQGEVRSLFPNTQWGN